MFCKNCGKEQGSNVKFCYSCGTAIDAVPAQQHGQSGMPQQSPTTPPQPALPTQPPEQSAQPGYQQQHAQPRENNQPGQPYAQPYSQPSTMDGQQYNTPAPPRKKSKKPLIFGIAGGAAAVLALAFALFILPLLQKDDDIEPPIDDGENEVLEIIIDVEPPGARDADFEAGETSYTTNDPNIRMIEVNQSLSYGFDSGTGEFYLMESFVAGKDTAVFIDLDGAFDPKAQVMLSVEKNGEPVATLTEVEVIDDKTLMFHPRDMSEVGYWEQGIYTFTFMMDDSVAVRTTNFYRSGPMKVLAVPIRGNYSGDIRACEGEWKLGGTMLSAIYPVAREDMEYVLGPEQDFSDPKYDLNSKDGRKNVWKELCALQTPNNDYTMIVGYMRTPTVQGYLGYTYGGEATIVCESEPDLLATVVHEIAHCYKIGDEYPDGSMNVILNPPPYGMEGHDILTGEPAVGTKEHVQGGETVGLKSTGSVIYPEQRAYWHEGREQLGTKTSYMSSGTGEDAFMFWTSSDIWNHLFKVFTGQLTGNEAGYGTGSGEDSEPQGENWGQCFECFGDVYEPEMYIECTECAKMVKITGGTFSCSDCGATYKEKEVSEGDLWIYHAACGLLLKYPKFVEYNQGSTNRASGDVNTVLEIRGSFDSAGVFSPDPWYSYQTEAAAITANRDGEYSASVYDAGGRRLSIAYFDVTDNSQINTREGYKWGDGGEETDIPIKVVVRFPENAVKVALYKGEEEVYVKELSENEPKVSFTNLITRQILANQTTLTWEAGDADGDDLTYRIWYYHSEDEMYLIATDVKGTSYEADLTDYPGGEQVWFVILASDGVRTGMAESPKVSVPYKAPDILNVIPEGKRFKVTDLIEIVGKVYDAQDGWLWNEGYEWYVDGRRYWSGYEGYMFWHPPYMLAPGTHTITMKVTNSAGISSSKDFNIEIIEDESDIPDGWPRNDLTLALRLGYYQPLHRLEAPITRLEFAKMMFSFYSLVQPDEISDDDDWIIPHDEKMLCMFSDLEFDPTDLDYTYAMLMVSIGLMEPKNATYEYIEELDIIVVEGEFDPHGTLTEREAMQIMYLTNYFAKSQTYSEYKVMDESEFIPQVTEWGMFGDEPDSFYAYNANERMSKGMTMIRIARFAKYEFEMEDKDYGIDAGFFDNYYDD